MPRERAEWLPGLAARQQNKVVAAVLQPRRVVVLSSDGGEILSTVGVCGHDISALLLDPKYDLLYTVGGAPAVLRAWNFRTGVQRWSWAGVDSAATLGVLRKRSARQGVGAATEWRRERNYARYEGEPRMFVTGHDALWVAGPGALHAFHRRVGRELWGVALQHSGTDAANCVVAHNDIIATVQHGSGAPDSCEVVAYAGAGEIGKELWRQRLPTSGLSAGKETGMAPDAGSSAPSVHWLTGLDGRLHYIEHTPRVLGGRAKQRLVSRDVATGQVLWQRLHNPDDGVGVVVRLEARADTLWMFCGGRTRLVFALNPADGSCRWNLQMAAHVHTHGYLLSTRCVAVWVGEEGDVDRGSGRAFISDGKLVHGVHLSTGKPIEGWGGHSKGKLKLGHGFTKQSPPSLLVNGRRLLILRRTAGERVAMECRLLSVDCAGAGRTHWDVAGQRAAGSISLYGSGVRGWADALVGTSRVPAAGVDTGAAGQVDLHLFCAHSGKLRAVHSAPIGGEHSWQLVPDGVVVCEKRDKSQGRYFDSLCCLDHGQPRDFAEHTVSNISSAHLDLAARSNVGPAAVRWTWSSKASDKGILVWQVHPGHGLEIFVLSRMRTVHVLKTSTGTALRSLDLGSAAPVYSRHGRQDAVGAGRLLVEASGEHIMLNGVQGMEGIMFRQRTGAEVWRPAAFGGAVLLADQEGASKTDARRRRPSTAGAAAEVGAGACLLSSSVVVTLAIDPAERDTAAATGTFFGRCAHTGTLWWSLSFTAPGGHHNSQVGIWPLRRNAQERKMLSLSSTLPVERAAIHFKQVASAVRLLDCGGGCWFRVRRSQALLFVVTRSRADDTTEGPRFHLRCFDATRGRSQAAKGVDAESTNRHQCLDYVLGAGSKGGELWCYPPGQYVQNSENSIGMITALEVTPSCVIVGCISGRLHFIRPADGQLLKTIDWLHVEEVSAMTINNGMLWSVSSEIAVLKLRPLTRFGVVAAATETQLSSTLSRFQALHLALADFWFNVVMMIVEAGQLFRFASMTKVCGEDQKTCIMGYQLKQAAGHQACDVSNVTSNSSGNDHVVGPECCACGGGDSDTDLLKLPWVFTNAFKKVSDFGLDQLGVLPAFWSGVSLVALFMVLVLLVAEPLKRLSFFAGGRAATVLLSVLAVSTQLLCQPLLVPVLRLLARSLDCTYHAGEGWLLDNSGVSRQHNATSAAVGATGGWIIEHEWQRCWQGAHMSLAAVGLTCLLLYLPLVVRLLRCGSIFFLDTHADVGGSAGSRSGLGRLVRWPWVVCCWCSRSHKDDERQATAQHPFSACSPQHRLLVVCLKAAGVLAVTFLGDKHRLLVGALLTTMATLLVGLSCLLRPFYSEVANRFRAALDCSILLSYCAALGMIALLQEEQTSIAAIAGTAPRLFYASEADYRTSIDIAHWLPICMIPAFLMGWFLRPCRAYLARACSSSSCGVRDGGAHRVHPLPTSTAEAAQQQLRRVSSAAVLIQHRQRLRSSGRKLREAESVATTTRQFGFATSLPGTASSSIDPDPSSLVGAIGGAARVPPATVGRRQRRPPVQLPPLAATLHASSSGDQGPAP